MRRNHILIAAGVMSGIVGLVAASVPGNFVENGSFELPLQNPHFSTPRGPGASLTGWVISGPGVDHAYNAWETAHGNRSLSLNWTGASTVTQEVSTDSGERYRLSFAMAAESYGGPQFRTLDVTWNGDVMGSFTFDFSGHSPADMGWEYHELEVIGTGLDALGIVSTTPGAYGPGLDDVSLTATLCVCEFDGDSNRIDVSDLLAFLADWFAEDAGTDIDGIPGVDVGDLLAFLACWFPASAGAGCP